MLKKTYKQKLITSLLIGFGLLGYFKAFALAAPPSVDENMIMLNSIDKLQSPWEIAINPNHAKSIRNIMKQWPISMLTLGKQKLIKMTYDFSGNNLGRALYKKKVKLDLSNVSTIEMDVMVSNPATLRSGMSIFFKSGNGWYSGSVIPRGKMQWDKIRISRGEFRQYGEVSGWENITEIRFSPWALAREAGEIYVANLGFMPPNCKVAILKQDFKNKKPSAGYLYNMIAYVNNLMDSGIIPLPVSSLNYDKNSLGKEWIIFLPPMPNIRKETVKQLCAHINNGGKIVAIGSLHPDIAKCLGIKLNKYNGVKGRGDLIVSKNISSIIPQSIPIRDTLIVIPAPISKDGFIFAQWRPLESKKVYPGAFISSKGAYIANRMRFRRNQTSLLLLGILSKFDKSIIEKAANYYLKGPSWSFDCSWSDAQKEIKKLANYSKVKNDCEIANKILINANLLFKKQKYSDALNAFVKAKILLKNTYIKAWKMPDFEFFGSSIRGDMPMSKLIPFLKACHITDVTIKIGSGTASAYSNSIKPQWKKYRLTEKKDYMIKRIKAFTDGNIKVWIERQNLVTSKRELTSKEFDKLKKENRLAISSNGKTVDYWLCPTHPDIIKEQCTLMLECANIPGVQGVCFDLIRYTTMPDTCFCPRCKRLFEERIKHKVKWNQDVSGDGKYSKEWRQFRTDNITNIVKAASAAVRKAKPNMKIMAYVFSNYPACVRGNGQDWKLWIKKGYIDKAGPMNYVNGTNAFKQMVKTQGKALGGCEKLYPGIGLTEGLGTIEALRQITAAQEAGVKGVYLFAFWGSYVRTVFAHLGDFKAVDKQSIK